MLQALHWVIQSARHPSVDTNKSIKDGSTLALNDAIYLPSPDYKKVGNEGVYGNFQNSKKLDLKLTADMPDGTRHDIKLWLKAARNEGLSVHIPSNNEISATIRDRQREFSAYIPGLAGIPLSEERRARSIAIRQAAAGDANTVLRNILLLLSQEEESGETTPFTELQERVSAAIRPTELDVQFDDQVDYFINATFKVDDMVEPRALELAGIGFLQAIQIFAYIILYRPRLLLIDEPDSHLHPGAQERLVREIAKAARDHDCQVIMTTHSPNVMRALPDGANIIWMKDGEVQENAPQAGLQMGWGILDKKLVLLTEDGDTDMLRLLLSQWPDLERQVAIWSLYGTGNLPNGTALTSLSTMLGDVPMLLHRDGDMMLDIEKDLWRDKKGLSPRQTWITEGADIESYFVSADYISAITGRSKCEVHTEILEKLTVQSDHSDFKKKRIDARALYSSDDSVPSRQDAFDQLAKSGVGHVLKKSIKKVRGKVQDVFKGGLEKDLGKTIPDAITLAPDLKKGIEVALGPRIRKRRRPKTAPRSR